MASLKNLFSTLLHAPRTLSFPISPPRTHFFVGSLRILSFFFFFSATFADTSPVVAAETLVSRLLPTSNRASPTNSCAHLVSNSHGTRTEGTSLSAVKETRKSPRNSESDAVGDLSSCDIFDGNWVLDDSEPVYPPGSCPYIDDAFNCFKNGRPDSDYLRFRWKPQGCQIPRFDGRKMLKMLRGKRLVFVGDSLNRNMWESLVCALRESLVDKSRVFEVSGKREFRTQGFYSFRFLDYKCSIDFVRSPFLVQETISRTLRATLRLDVIQDSSSKYRDADIIVFNTGHWWTHQKTYRGQNYFQEGKHVYNKLEVTEAYTKALRTWAQWVDANIDSNRTRVFFRGFSASHFRGGQWNSGGNCDGETRPITNETQLAPYPWMMRTLESVIAEMITPVLYLNITKMTDYRKDGHPSIFRQPEASRSNEMVQDCSHWCLPGVPDSWNELLYATLLTSSYGSRSNRWISVKN
ncbi:hypothetical protein AAG906_027713 [Vitis piasezkii]